MSDNTFLALNPDGLKLFDAAVNYASGGKPTVSIRDYSIGLNFGADEVSGTKSATLAATDVAGVPSVAQANWNNLETLTGTANNLTADAGGTAEATTATVTWNSNNTWASVGSRG